MISTNFMRNLNANLRRLADKNDMIAAKRKIRRPSDDPVGAAMALKLNRQLTAIEQYNSNAEDALTWMKNTESVLTNVGNIMHRLKELTIEAANGHMTPDDRQKTLNEVTELKEQIFQEANSTHVDRYLFSGYNTDKPPFIKDADGKIIVNPDITDPQDNIEFNLGANERIPVNILGSDVFPDIFRTVEGIEKALDDNDTEALSGHLQKDIQDCTGIVLKYRSQIGARTNRLEDTISRLDINSIDTAELLSKTVSLNWEEAITELKMDEAVYRMSLAVGARIIQPNLTDFLR